jgi:hypothetical protein
MQSDNNSGKSYESIRLSTNASKGYDIASIASMISGIAAGLDSNTTSILVAVIVGCYSYCMACWKL